MGCGYTEQRAEPTNELSHVDDDMPERSHNYKCTSSIKPKLTGDANSRCQ